MVIGRTLALSAAFGGIASALIAIASCGPGDGCEITLTCPTSGSSTGGAGGSGVGGTTPSGGATGVGGPSCGNGVVESGEVCFPPAAADYPTQGEEGRDLVLVDCDDDGDLDAVVAHFAGMEDTALAWTVTPTAPIAGNFLGDAGEELALLAPDDNDVKLFENVAGALSSSPNSVPPGGVGDTPVAIASGDVNGDGTLDIVTANRGSGSIAVLRNLGGGGFATQAPEPSVGPNATAPVAVALGDIDGDGDLDAVTANQNDGTGYGSISIFLNDGDGKLTLHDEAIQIARMPVAIRLADLDNDGALDLITVSSHVDGNISVISVARAQPWHGSRLFVLRSCPRSYS